MALCTMFIQWATLALIQIACSLGEIATNPTQYEIAAILANGDKSHCTTILFGLDYQWIKVRANA